MNISPPLPSPDSRLARLPAVNARILNRPIRNIGWATLASTTQKTASSTAAGDGADHERAGPAHRVLSVRLNAVGDPDRSLARRDLTGLGVRAEEWLDVCAGCLGAGGDVDDRLDGERYPLSAQWRALSGKLGPIAAKEVVRCDPFFGEDRPSE